MKKLQQNITAPEALCLSLAPGETKYMKVQSSIDASITIIIS